MYMWNWYKKWACPSSWESDSTARNMDSMVSHRDGPILMHDFVIMGDSITKSFRCFNES